jgi:hypothetical protein
MVSVPAGGSIAFEVSANGIPLDDAGTSAFCGACLAVPSALDGADAVLAFLRANAPRCPGVQRDSAMLVRVTGYASPQCAGAPTLCSQSPAVAVPDGTTDAQLAAPLTCRPCSSAPCVPTSCQAQGKNCGFISDGCTQLLNCGTCDPPSDCGRDAPNVCPNGNQM